MSWVGKVNKKICPSGINKIKGRGIRLKSTTGAPNTAAPVGTIVWNSFDGDAYICTVASGTYVKINN